MKISEDSRVEQYLARVSLQIKSKEVRPEIRAELLGHLEEAVEQYLGDNVSEEEAIGMALEHMGEPLSLGRKLQQVHKAKIEWRLIFLVGICILFGLFNLYLMQQNDLLMFRNQYFERTITWVVIGILLVMGIQWVNYRRLQAVALYIYFGTLLLWLLAFNFHHLVNGKPYLYMGSVQMNLVDVTPYLLIMSLAGLFSQWNWNSKTEIIKGFLLGIFPIVLYCFSNALSVGITFFILFLLLMRESGARKRITLWAGLLMIGFSIVISCFNSSLIRQLAVFVHPGLNSSGGGWIYARIAEIIYSANWRGYGLSLSERNLPAIHTDLVLIYIIYTFGWLVGSALMLLALTVVIRMFIKANRIRDLHGRLTVLGLAGILCIQILWNVFMTIGLAPIDGLGFPFLSYGGTQLIIQLMAIGLILNIFRYRDSNIVRG